MSTAAANMMLKCFFNGSLSEDDMNIERRPYCCNCSYALHKSKGADGISLRSTVQHLVYIRRRSSEQNRTNTASPIGIQVGTKQEKAKRSLSPHLYIYTYKNWESPRGEGHV
ncbi:hypothetical protein RJ639_036973 [Escallonia herrerae]|uniref:Uncharacterized protein n=1 Tax=Escallonia herrerae TaxID=1293975 RepID=A0AA89BIN3_9ASTE|nr:hypothetical protein RJ639_036973 [Escallonia herrerae]